MAWPCGGKELAWLTLTLRLPPVLLSDREGEGERDVWRECCCDECSSESPLPTPAVSCRSS